MDDRRGPWWKRTHPLPLLVAFALGAAIVGGATAAGELITGADVKNNSLTGADVRNSSLTGADIRNGSVRLADLAPALRPGLAGPAGPAGATGQQGPKGDTGPAGPSALPVVRSTQFTAGVVAVGTEHEEVMSLTVPDGRYLVLATAGLEVNIGTVGSCRLFAGGVFLQRQGASYPNPSSAMVTSKIFGGINLSATTPPGTTVISVTCGTGGGTANVIEGNVVAIPVA